MEPYLNREQMEAQEKAQVLIEALPYIQKFNRKIIVVKYGGSAMSDEELQRSVIQDVTLLKLVGFKPIAEMVLGSVSKKLVSMVEELGIRAIGISGKDGNLLHVQKKYADGQDIGFVGEVTDVDPKILFDMLENDYLPIVAPLGMDDDFNTYNINADEAASAIARAVCADKLVYLTDITGVLRSLDDPNSLISRINIDQADKLIQDGIVGGGMLPKLANCTDAVRGGVHRVHILDGRIPHCILLEIFTDNGVGTVFYKGDYMADRGY